MNEPNIRRMIGNPYKNPMGGLLKDSDRDGVINVLDCRPHNAKKQGWVHGIKQKLSERAEMSKRLRQERREREYVITTKAEEAAYQERIKQAEETAKYKERQIAEKKRKYIKEGGFVGRLSRGMENIARELPSASRPMAPVRRRVRVPVVTKKGKKGKKGKIRYRYVSVTPKPKQPQSLQSYMDTQFKGLF